MGFYVRLANRPFLVFDFRALWRLTLGAEMPESELNQKWPVSYSLASNP